MKFNLIIICSVLANVAMAQKYDLTLHLQKDSTYKLKSTSKVVVDQSLPDGTKQTINMNLSGLVSHKVTAIHDTVYEMEVRYKSLNLHMDVNGTTSSNMSTDDNDQSNPYAKVMRGLLDKPFTINITRGGKIVDIRNMDNLYNGMFDQFPDLSAAQKAAAKAQVQQSFGEKAFTSTFQETFAMLPKNKVGIADNWSNSNTLQSIVSVNYKTNYTMQAVTDNSYVIHGKAQISTDKDADYKPYQNIMMRLSSMQGTSDIELKIDKKTGWPVSSISTRTVNCVADVKLNSGEVGQIGMMITGNSTVGSK